MLPLASSSFPTTADALRGALEGGLAQVQLTPRSVLVSGESFPQLEQLHVDLTGASVSRTMPRPKPGPALSGEVQARDFSLHADPLLVEGAPVRLQVKAQGVTLREHSAQGVERFLIPQRAERGTLELEIRTADLQRLALAAAQEAAKQHGLQVTDLQLELQATGGRTLAVKSQVTAKFGFIKATLDLTGQAAVNDELELQLSNLDVQGQGMASSMAVGFVKPQLAKISQRPIPLNALPLGGMKLREVQVFTGESLRIQAELGA